MRPEARVLGDQQSSADDIEETVIDPRDKLKRSIFEKIIKANEDKVSPKMENLGEFEFLIYGFLSAASALTNLLRGKGPIPNATLFANFAESLPEIFSKKVQQGEHAITGIFETFGNFCTGIFGQKDSNGQLIKGAKSLATNQRQSQGSMILLLNSLGIVNSIYHTAVNGYRILTGQQEKETGSSSFAKYAMAGSGSSLAFLNAISMWLISSTQEKTSHALKAMQPEDRTEKEAESMEGIYGGANEDYRCGLKSLFASASTLADALIPGSWGGMIDSLGGLFLNWQGISNGQSMLKGEEEEEDSRFPHRFNGSFLNSIRPFMNKISNWFFAGLDGVPKAEAYDELAKKPDDISVLWKFHAALA